MSDSLFDRFQNHVASEALVAAGERVLLAVSGGVDSMTMLSLFARSARLGNSHDPVAGSGVRFDSNARRDNGGNCDSDDLPVGGGYRFAVAHCNFCLRGGESDGDERLVVEQCRELGVECHVRRFDTAGEVERTGDSVQMAARRLRYEWFDELCREHGYAAVAIAHHADDAIETFFINLLRGTGLRGLTGLHGSCPGDAGVFGDRLDGADISAARLPDAGTVDAHGRVIRPMLFASRSEILDYATEHGVTFREDSSNRSTKYLRNKIRLELLPEFREINPGFATSMGDTLRRLTSAQAFIDHSIELIRSGVEQHRDGLTVIDPSKIDPGLPLGFVLFELLSVYGFRGETVDRLACALHSESPTGKRFYSTDHVAYIDRGKIIVAPLAEDDDCQTEIAAPSGTAASASAGCTERTGEGRSEAARRTLCASAVSPTPSFAVTANCGNSALTLELIPAASVEKLQQPDNVALLDAGKVRFPLFVRRWHDGDRFTPLGMTGTKKVSDYLVDVRVPLAEKRRQLVVESGGRIVWLVGRRIDHDFRVTPATENILKITVEAV